jgi:hypothetical protein
MTHVASLGLDTVRGYQSWCRDHGLSGALNKGWQERRSERALARKLADQDRDGKAFERHLLHLGMASESEYRDWCRANDLSDSTHKSESQRSKEVALLARIRSQAALAGSRRQSRRTRETVELVFDGALGREALKAPHLRRIHDTLATLAADTRDAFRRLLLHAEQHTDLLGSKPAIPRLGQQPGNTYVEGLAAIARWHEEWIRPPTVWRPDTHNSRRQFGALARHLLADYCVPAFMDTAWFLADPDDARRQQGWFVHIGKGHNIRTADVPLVLTKKMAHLFLEAPDGYTIEEALRHGQVLGMGGDTRLVRAVNATRLGQGFEEEPFWQTVIRFFVNNPMLDIGQIGPIVDYIHNQKFVPEETVLPGGGVVRQGPCQPHFAMKGRSAAKLVRQVEAWHRRLAREERLPNREWARSGITPFELTDRGEKPGGSVTWQIRELLSTKELVSEGRAMHHCVGSYSGNCQKGNTSIWSMQVARGDQSPLRVMTIAVNNRSRIITQARGRYNALPSGRTPNGRNRGFDSSYSTYLKQTRKILYMWREQEGLAMGSYV